MHIAFETPDQPEVIALIADLDAYHLTLYPPESVYALDLATLKQPHVKFAVVRDAAGEAVGCGAVVLTPGYGEIKRMYLQPACRGQGAADRLLDMLEDAARAAGCPRLTLETGPSQPPALALYARHGFRRCAPYGDYRDDPLSVFMEKPLVGGAQARASDLTALRDELRAFTRERDWEQFHTPKNLAMALSVEVAELVEHFQWLPTGADAELDEQKRTGIRHELADVLAYLIQLADKTNVDLAAALREKMELNRRKYPAERVRGDARKYSDY
ncbi:GNAT family N-acetyltransferase [Duganella sp. LX20W]|uniref:GNAT family N-acetyltransferase n=1 Tax=Rugamonas brunnea TaxID=2758569 RepID=A0A7W2IE46_9BURK|nr:GNAT family N-acetyltransferase [Rugamonas brunnea]MBA5640226.1 GNAT family N-acetyltransferase [Rugamonas brunnea]